MKNRKRYRFALAAALLLLAVLFTVSGCGGPKTPVEDGFSAKSLMGLLGCEKAEVAKGLGVDLDSDATLSTDVSESDNAEIYELNNYVWLQDTNCALVLEFYGGVLGGYQFLFDTQEGKNTLEAGFDFAKEMSQSLTDTYGEAVTGDEIPARLSQVSSAEQLEMGYQYIEQWQAKDSAALTQTLFGQESQDDLYVTLMLEGNGEADDRISRVILEYSLPYRLEG